jgi:hypothetical protein
LQIHLHLTEDGVFFAKNDKMGVHNICSSCGGKLIQIYPKPKLGEIFLQLGYIREEELETALKIQRSLSEHILLGQIISKLKSLQGEILLKALKIQEKSLELLKTS